MTATSSLHRRTLLSALLTLPVLSGTAGAAATLNGGVSEQASPGDGLAAIFSNRRSASILGQAYLMQRPEEADAQRLEALLLSPDNLKTLSSAGISPDGIGTARPAALKQAFQDLRRWDFEDGDVLQIDGCMLSVTELRLCALVALA